MILEKNTKKPNNGQLASIGSIFFTVALACIGYWYKDPLIICIFVGALGGVIHEIAQSNGRFMLPKLDNQANDVYLGGLFGLIGGGVAGLILSQGFSDFNSLRPLVTQAFLAGLSFKGLAEAVATARPPEDG